MKTFWNKRYYEPNYAYGTLPNEFLSEQLALLQPGKLLLPCEGEGRNAVYAAAKGWQVVAFDQSEAGLEKCERLAAAQHVQVHYQVADAGTFDYGLNQYDAIALIFAHFPPALRHQVHHKCVQALKPGGILILEAFAPEQLHYQSGGPEDVQLLYHTNMLEADFAAMQQLTITETLTTLQEGPYHQGTAAVMRLVGQK